MFRFYLLITPRTIPLLFTPWVSNSHHWNFALNSWSHDINLKDGNKTDDQKILRGKRRDQNQDKDTENLFKAKQNEGKRITKYIF